jgi:hypothetical protein
MMRAVYLEAERRLKKGNNPYVRFKEKYWNDPAKFVKDCVWFRGKKDERATNYQLGIMNDLIRYKRVAIRGPRGLGKTAIAAWIILWFALTRDGRDWKIGTTASVWRQVNEFLWPEVHKWTRALRWERIGRSPLTRNELMKVRLELETGHAFGVASTNAGYVEGAHAKHLLYIFDEARLIPDAMWNSTEGAFSSPDTDEAFALAISTPGEPVGRFYDIHEQRPGLEDWHPRHVTLAEATLEKRISKTWAERMKVLWGESSSQYQNHVLGNFAVADEEGLIPIHWVEAANTRYKANGASTDTDIGIGIDIGRTRDQSVIAVRRGSTITDIHRLPTTDTMGTTGLIINYLRMNDLTNTEPVVDVVGIGAGVVDRLREQSIDVIAYHASERTDFKDKSGELEFLNKRAAGWWKLREALDPAGDNALALPPDDVLLREITAPHWESTSTGKIKVDSKKAIRKRIHRSTDSADAIIMALYGADLENTFAGGTVGVIEIPTRNQRSVWLA